MRSPIAASGGCSGSARPNFLLFAGSEGENFFFGIVFIATLIAFLVVQPRYLAIYSSRLAPILFFAAPGRANVERFSQTLLAIARQAQASHRSAATPTARPRDHHG
ncbi:MAG: hypothetical protein HC838_07290 [Spirulinaceae cyanobacterium RM2_2_10]|nr:hypothetical protein [Spirulinaceae cyanobacterium RM2_2_10]